MRPRLFPVGLLLAVLSIGCAKTEAAPPLFGGTGATVDAAEKPLPPAEATPNAGACGAAAPPSDTALFDDFEDGDHKIFKGYRREGWWFAADDKTPGALLYPGSDLVPERLGAEETGTSNLFAAHFSASGQRDWGAIWGVGVSYTDNGVRCPLNVSSFRGLKFRAKGKGTLRLAFGMPETLGAESKGACKTRCWDTHGKMVFLTEGWQDYVVTWEQLQQEGWGTEARFDPARILQVAFSARVKELPVDGWVDDLTFITQSAPVASAANE